jgi:hypothetical protein
MERNFFIGNAAEGLRVNQRASDDAPPVVDRFVLNTIVGNAYTGVQVAGAPIGLFERNNIYGNGVGNGEGPATGCGLAETGGFAGGNQVARNNFWGSASGPGPDPADRAGPGSGCDSEGAETVVAPFAAAPFAVDVTTDD